MNNAAEWRTRALDLLAHERLLGARNAARQALRVAEGVKQRSTMAFTDAPIIPGLLSVVVPAYDVEDYIVETLDSLSRQDYRSIEVIVVDDGSPDRSRDIVRSYMLRDPRVKLVRKQNQGLGAARNTGVEHARGEFLAFLDSDDTVDRFVYREAIESLRATGSDFAVTPYRRIVKGDLHPAAWWIDKAHARYRPGCTLAEFPAIMVNAVAWSKIYRRSFWNAERFSFPTGVLYEDQELSARAYAEAERFDVMPRIGLNWRVRHDRSSITQQVVSVRNVVDHWRAAHASLDVLSRHSLADAHRARLLQYLNFNMGEFLPQIRAMDADAWEAFRAAVINLLSELPEGAWADVDARAKVMLTLVRDDERESALRFLEQDGWDRHRFSGHVVGDHVAGELPCRHDPRLPPDVFQFSGEETKLIAILRAAETDLDRSVLSLRLLGFIDSIDCVRWPQEISLTLVDADTGAEVPAAMAPDPHPSDSLCHTRPYADVSLQSWRADIDLARLAAGRRWELLVTATVSGIRRQQQLGYDDRSPLADPRWVVDGARFALLADEEGRLTITSIDLGSLAVDSMIADESGVTVELTLGGAPVDALSWRDVDDRLALPRSITPLEGHGTITMRMPLPRTLSTPERLRQCFALQARGVDGRWRTIPFAQSEPGYTPDGRWSTRPYWPTLSDATADGYGGYRVLPGDAMLIRHFAAVMVDSIRVDDSLTLSGRLLAAGHDATAASVVIRSEWFDAGWSADSDGRAEVIVPLRHNNWNLGERPLPEGPQTVQVVCGSGAAGLDVEDAFASTFPQEHYTENLLLICRHDEDDELEIGGHPPLPVRDREPGHAQRLRNEAASIIGLADPPFALFRSLYGEATNDSALATHERLRQRNTDLDLVWAVRDDSVIVPEGARTVIENSREYYEAFRRANYLMVNVHQPIWHHRPEGQVIIETFHGYPFKQNGLSWWQALGFTPERIASFLRRAREWDYLVSPAGYATDPLLDFFPDRDPGPTEVLEIGYPRNDALFGEQADKLRQLTRQRLGIRDDQIAVLYGPTFRDYVSIDDMSAKMLDFLDYQKLVSRFGDKVVLLGRGHPFNARAGTDLARQVLNVTEYPDVNDLIAASDAAILDYSSLRFDYALTRKPMVFLVPDRERYFAGRKSFISYHDTAPGPWADTTDEVIDVLADLKAADRAQAAAREQFIDKFMELEDGRATDRLIDAVFVPRGHASPGT